MNHHRKIIITGGAGFIGSNLAVNLKKNFQDISVTAVDNLMRRGSELNLPRLKEHGVNFTLGDVRSIEECDKWPNFDLLIDCAAEPSVLAGLKDSPREVIEHNLNGAINCFEAARKNDAALLFMSTSRVFPIGKVNSLETKEIDTRYEWTCREKLAGLSPEGISEDFPLNGARSVYGATKLAAELLLQEYVYSYDMPAIINRSGIIAGPWQMGKADQGVVALWTAKHYFGEKLKYIGFGGNGKQVRDILHIDDFCDLMLKQMSRPDKWDGTVYNIGGGRSNSVSLMELTEICQQVSSRKIEISSESETSPVDVKIYLTDSSLVRKEFDWNPHKTPLNVVEDIYKWISDYEESLGRVLE